MKTSGISRLDLGTFVRPGAETSTGHPRVEAVYGYLIDHPHGLVLLDTGIGHGDRETEDWYRPSRVPLQAALAAHGHVLDDLDVVVNCHLHFDHCGGNTDLGHTPVICQSRELKSALGGAYTFEHLVDPDNVNYQLVDGAVELMADLHVIPTPGHVDGHQSMVAVCDDGTVVLAGQSHDTTSQWSADALSVAAKSLGHHDPLPPFPTWMPTLLDFDPRRVVFAHDAAVWEPGRQPPPDQALPGLAG